MLETSERLLRLLALLQARRFWTGSELSSRLEVSERTVRRDVDRLRRLGYPVDSSVGVAGGYQLSAGASLPPLLLDDDEALAVSLALRTAAAGSVSGIEESALRALGKLERVLPKRLRRRVQAMQDAVVPLYFAGGQVSAATLTALASASREHQQAVFRYGDRSGKPSRRCVEPHGLVHTGTRWYLVAWDVHRGDWRTFRVDRMSGPITTAQPFLPRAVPDGDLGAFVSRSVASRAHLIRAKVVFHAPHARVAERIPPLAGYLKPLDKRRCVLESGADSLVALAYYVASVGEDFEVKEPPELKQHMEALAARLSRAVARR